MTACDTVIHIILKKIIHSLLGYPRRAEVEGDTGHPELAEST